jgi:hypothetical protein
MYERVNDLSVKGLGEHVRASFLSNERAYYYFMDMPIPHKIALPRRWGNPCG